MDFEIEIISIEGNIGSGKSTLLNKLRLYIDEIIYLKKENKVIKIIYLDEPLDTWELIKDENNITLLEKYYDNQEKYAFSFQLNALFSRIKLLKDAINKEKELNIKKEFIKGENYVSSKIDKLIIITDRSIFNDKMVFTQMLYDIKKINIIDYQIYLNLFSIFEKEFPLNKIIYVNSSSHICNNRITKRNRIAEVNKISYDYLKLCEYYHENMIYKLFGDNINQEKLLVLNGNDNINDTNILSNWIIKIKEFINLYD
jgi:deoxyadenosine/deoxycytidine kinase